MIKVWWRLVRFGFRLLYNEMAFTYDLVSKAVSMGQWRCWQRAALKYLPGRDHPNSAILELAHGTGDLQLDLAAAGYQHCTGYDLSAVMGRIAGRKLQKHGVTARLARGVAQQLPFANEAFDAIVCTFPTEFIFAEETLRDAWRVLRPNGRLVIVINGVFTGRGLLTRLLDGLYWITGQRTPPQFSSTVSPVAPTNAQQAMVEWVKDRFTRCGFQIEQRQEPCNGSYAQVIVADKIMVK